MPDDAPDDPSSEEIDFAHDRHALKNAIYRLFQAETTNLGVSMKQVAVHLDARDGQLLEHTIANQEIALYVVFQHPDSLHTERIDVTIGDFEWKPIVTITARKTPIQTIEISAKSAVVFQQIRSAIQICFANARNA